MIERFYYDEALEELEKWEAEITSAKEKMTKEDLFLQHQQQLLEFEQLMKEVQDFKAEKHLKHLDPRKKNHFLLLQKTSMEVAKICNMNFKSDMNEDTLFGYIELSYAISWIVSTTPKTCSKTLSTLYEHAYQVCTSINNNRIVQRFEFAL